MKYLLGVYLPLWKIWVRQIGSSSPIVLGKIKKMYETTNQISISIIRISNIIDSTASPFRNLRPVGAFATSMDFGWHRSGPYYQHFMGFFWQNLQEMMIKIHQNPSKSIFGMCLPNVLTIIGLGVPAFSVSSSQGAKPCTSLIYPLVN